jgi:hypothetical protein
MNLGPAYERAPLCILEREGFSEFIRKGDHALVRCWVGSTHSKTRRRAEGVVAH